MSGPARYIMIGGFLGAGKTTAVAALARHLTAGDQRVGLITNDQASGLVDTTVLRSRGFAVEEIAGGCFCCRFNSLRDAAGRLTEASRPDVFIAEPVGSCTDLVATVSYPLRRIYGDRFTVAPLSVLVDPHRAARILGLEPGRSFSRKVVYVYRKQLEEADLIVINKCDLLADDLRARLRDALEEAFPRARVLAVSAKEGTGLEDWFTAMTATTPAIRPTMELDYATYAEGEALLGWLNCTARVVAPMPVDGNGLLLDLAGAMREAFEERGEEIAHLKMTLDAEDDAGSLSVVSLVSSAGEPDLRESLLDRTDGGCLVVNLRAETDPERLFAVMTDAFSITAARHGVRIDVEHVERFRPAPPEPTHRVTVSG